MKRLDDIDRMRKDEQIRRKNHMQIDSLEAGQKSILQSATQRINNLSNWSEKLLNFILYLVQFVYVKRRFKYYFACNTIADFSLYFAG